MRPFALRPHLPILLVAASLSLSGCGFVVVHGARQAYASYTRNEKAVELRLDSYRKLVLQMDYEAISDLFDETAEFSHSTGPTIVGKAAILAYFRSSMGYRVLVYEIRPESTVARGDKAKATGTFHQQVIAPNGASISFNGTFESEWNRDEGGKWLLHRMHTDAAPISAGA